MKIGRILDKVFDILLVLALIYCGYIAGEYIGGVAYFDKGVIYAYDTFYKELYETCVKQLEGHSSDTLFITSCSY